MPRFTSYAGILTAAVFALMWVAPAQAQATRTWVSGVGDDVNPCSRTAPCKTFPGAISKTAAGGEIDVLDPGGFGGVTIVKAITIDGSPGSIGSILVAASPGVTVNAGANDTITLRNITMEGVGATTSASGTWGVRFIAGSVLNVLHCSIRNFRDPTNGTGILFAPASGTSKLFVDDTVLTGNGTIGANGGIVVKPSGSGSALVFLTNTRSLANSAGVRVDTTGTTGSVRGVMSDSEASGSTFNGVSAVAGSGVATLVLNRSDVSANANGLVVNGASASLYANNSVVTANATGLLQTTPGVGHLFSYKNNAVNNNTTADGAFTDLITPE